MNDKKPFFTIAVTGLNATDNPGAGVPVIRSLKESNAFDCRIIGLCYEALEPGAFIEGIVDVSYIIPYPSVEEKSFFERIKYIIEKEKIEVIIPNFDSELIHFIRLENKLEALNVEMFLPTEEQFLMRKKDNLLNLDSIDSLKVPDSINCMQLADFYDCEKSKFEFPVVVKGHLYEAFIAYNEWQLSFFFSSLVAKWGLPVIIQKYIEGKEFNIIGMGDGKGELLAAVCMRKQVITDKGKAWAGISIKDSKIIEIAKDFVKYTSWKGAFELELIKDKNGNYWILEINPRIPAWVYLSTASGQNIPEMIVLKAKHNEIQKKTEYKTGKMFVRCSWDLIVEQEVFAKFSVLGEK